MSTIEQFPSTTFAALPQDDLTVAEAWASSPLGDPVIEDGSLSRPAKFEDFPETTVTAKPRSRRSNALVVAAVVAALGMASGAGLMLLDGTGSAEQKPAVVAPNSSVGAVTPQTPSAVPPPPTAVPDPGQPPAGGGADAPVVTIPAPVAAPADPGAPADAPAPADPGAPPPPPSVTVNIPPVIPVPIPIPVPPQQGGGQQGGGQQGGGHPPIVHGPIECLACQHPPVKQQPVQPKPVQPQPVQPQPVKPQPIQPHPIQPHP